MKLLGLIKATFAITRDYTVLTHLLFPFIYCHKLLYCVQAHRHLGCCLFISLRNGHNILSNSGWGFARIHSGSRWEWYGKKKKKGMYTSLLQPTVEHLALLVLHVSNERHIEVESSIQLFLLQAVPQFVFTCSDYLSSYLFLVSLFLLLHD